MKLFYVPVILGSIRDGRQSAKVAEFVKRKLEATGRIEAEVLDLREMNLPMMSERLKFLKDPPQALVGFGEKMGRSDAFVIVTPEYNSGYPGVLKNAIDYLYPEYHRKPAGLVTVSAGTLGGVRVLEQLRNVMFSVGAIPIPSQFLVSKVRDAIDGDGTSADPAVEKRADGFISELLWYTEAISDRKAKDSDGSE